MSSQLLPGELRAFLEKYQLSMDHVAVLLVLRAEPGLAHTAESVATRALVTVAAAAGKMEEIARSGLVTRNGAAFQFAQENGNGTAIDQLADLYNTRPVTLVRAIYDRPSAARSFADAFRIRRTEA